MDHQPSRDIKVLSLACELDRPRLAGDFFLLQIGHIYGWDREVLNAHEEGTMSARF